MVVLAVAVLTVVIGVVVVVDADVLIGVQPGVLLHSTGGDVVVTAVFCFTHFTLKLPLPTTSCPTSDWH